MLNVDFQYYRLLLQSQLGEKDALIIHSTSRIDLIIHRLNPPQALSGEQYPSSLNVEKVVAFIRICQHMCTGNLY